MKRWVVGVAVTLFAATLVPTSACVVRERLGGDAEGGFGGEEPVEPGSGGSQSSTAASSGTGGVDPALVIAGVDCDWQTSLKQSCAISVCHGTRLPYAGLNLTPDAELVARIKDVPVTLRDLDCDPTAGYLACELPPPECTADIGAKIVDSANPDASYVFTKMSGTHGCGNTMPLEPGNDPARGWGEQRRACIQALVRAIAAL